MKAFVIILIAALLFIGSSAGTTLNLSGTSPASFDRPEFADDGIAGGAGGSDITTSQANFMKSGNETNAKIAGVNIARVGSSVLLNQHNAPNLPPMASQVKSYLVEQATKASGVSEQSINMSVNESTNDTFNETIVTQ